jgi:O-antigen ligase
MTLAAIVGLAIAYDLPKGVALLFLIGYVPLVIFDVAAALAVYVALIFIGELAFTGPSETLAGLLVLAAWAGALRRRAEVVREHPVLTAAFAGFLVWTALSMLWGEDVDAALALLLRLVVALLAFVVTATLVRSERQYRLVLWGFLAGAVLITLAGFAEQGLSTARSATEVATQVDQGRLSAGGGDPNYLAAGLLPTLVIGAGLFRHVRDPLARLGLFALVALLPVGIFASQSRGALVAAGATLLAALVIARRHRIHVLAMILALASVSTVWLAANPAAAERIVNFDDGGAGRSDLWRVGSQMWQDNPVIGVGFASFENNSPRYARRPGAIRLVKVIAESPHAAHNLYLQTLAETGVIGLLLLLGVVYGCMASTWSAVRRFAAQGRRALETDARLLLIAQIGFLAASFFLSNIADVRLWVLLALGPALLTVSRVASERRG